MRELKFRVWDRRLEGWRYLEGIYNMPDPEYTGNDYQYTGLKDKNGKEIYEGDILEKYAESGNGEYRSIGEVMFSDGGFCLRKGQSEYSFSYIEGDTLPKEEIIGNIYENPELLNK